MFKLMASKLVFMIALLVSPSAFADKAQEEFLTSWYSALAPVNRDVFLSLLSDDVSIELKDYDVIQNKNEFIESLDSWEDAIEGGAIKFKIKATSSNEITTTIVCYTFSSNELMTEETFEFLDKKITSSVQVTIAEDCADF